MTDPLRSGCLLLYWDYELQIGADRSRRGRQQWGMDDHRQTEVLLDLLDEYGVRCTFAVVGFAAQDGKLPYHAPAQVRKIADRGHEVASHTWQHEWISSLTSSRLRQVLKQSKDQLESVIGRPVISFAPPWNVPTCFPARLAPGFYDWRGGFPRQSIPALCRLLRETGYQTARIDYEPLSASFSRHVLRRVVHQPAGMERVENILCFKVSGDGFGMSSQELLRRAAEQGGLAVIYAHPHSLVAENDQNIRYFMSFLELIKKLREQGTLVITTPGELIHAGA